VNRRKILAGIAGLSALPLISTEFQLARAAATPPSIAIIQARWRDFLSASAVIAKDTTPLNREVAQWRSELPQDAFEILFEEDTERPFSSHLNDEKRPGVFVCRACNCGGHQGHIFKDGPAPTGERWCNNGLALRFISGDE